MSLDNLTEELLLEIASYLTCKEMARTLAQLSRSWNARCSSMELHNINDLVDPVLPKSSATIGRRKSRMHLRDLISKSLDTCSQEVEEGLKPLIEALRPGHRSQLEARAKWYRKVTLDENETRRCFRVTCVITKYREIRGVPLLYGANVAKVVCKSDLGLWLLFALPYDVDLCLICGPEVSAAALRTALAGFTNVELTWEGCMEGENKAPRPKV